LSSEPSLRPAMMLAAFLPLFDVADVLPAGLKSPAVANSNDPSDRVVGVGVAEADVSVGGAVVPVG